MIKSAPAFAPGRFFIARARRAAPSGRAPGWAAWHVLVSHRPFLRKWAHHFTFFGQWLTVLRVAGHVLVSHWPVLRKWTLHFAIFRQWLTAR